MASLNSCNFIGRICRDPEKRSMQNGDSVTNITMAVDDSYKDKNGQKVEKCEWVNVTFYRKLADIVSDYCVKGMLVYISGKLETRKYTDKNGVDRYTTSIIAHEMQMLGSKSGGDQRPKQSSGFDDMDSNIPF